MEVTLGGDRLGSGNKQKVEMHNYQMSSFNLEQDFKSSMAPGILYPFLKMVGTNHGTFDIDLDSFVRTLPTRGPLFGSFKLQVDIFNVPMRLYQAILHNNPTKIGMKMNQVYLPKLLLNSYIKYTNPITQRSTKVPYPIGTNKYNYQINESSLLKYLGLSGLGVPQEESFNHIARKINAIPALAYYDIFKCYYSNKQEEKAYVITPDEQQEVYTNIAAWVLGYNNGGTVYQPNESVNTDEENPVTYINIVCEKREDIASIMEYATLEINSTAQTINDWINENKFEVTYEGEVGIDDGNGYVGYWKVVLEPTQTQAEEMLNSRIVINNDIIPTITKANIKLTPFTLENIDDMRTALLSHNNFGQEFIIGEDWTDESGTDATGLPYTALTKVNSNFTTYNQFDLNGLVVKTYQSDLFNNWLDSEWIEGEEGIAALTAISTQDGKFTIDSFVFAEKLYDIYNRIATGGGTYEDWQEAVYGEGAVRKAETPMYIGGMAAEVMFEEVISSAETNVGGDRQALGSLGGKGTIPTENGRPIIKGGHNIHVKCEEPSYIMGIVSLTPRVCYSQGNDWDLTELDTMDDLHKPGLDGIGFQDLLAAQFAWWGDEVNADAEVTSRDTVGKQTAWINYQTAVDKCYGDFAKQDGYSFMVLNRNYEMNGDPRNIEATSIKDVTTYIDPSKFNYAFAYDELAAQNFWIQIHSKVVARRKMGAQQIPNL